MLNIAGPLLKKGIFGPYVQHELLFAQWTGLTALDSDSQFLLDTENIVSVCSRVQVSDSAQAILKSLNGLYL
jgi:hypothetical protein